MPSKAVWVVLIVLVGYALFGGLHVLELRAEEPRRAIVALEMVLSGEYIAPRINGELYYNKPPLFNWLVAGTYKLTGSFSEWATRLPSVIGFLLMAVLQFLVARRYLGAKVALMSSVIFMTAGDLLFYGSIQAGELDLVFSAFVFAQVISIFWFYHKRQYLLMFLVSYLLAALGFLTKQPAVIFQGLTLAGFLGVHRRWGLLFGWQHALGLSAFAAVVGGYFYAYNSVGSAEAYLYNLFGQGVKRSAQAGGAGEFLTALGTFPFLLLKLLAPWSVLAVFFFRKGFLKEVSRMRLLQFSAVFIVANIWLYWTSAETKARYVYMFLPFFAILLAHFYMRFKHTWPGVNRILEIVAAVGMTLVSLAMGVLPFVLTHETENGVWRIPGYIPIAVAFCAAGLGLVFWARKQPVQRVWLFAALMLLGRGWYNLTVLPYTQASDALTYRDETMADVLAITGDAPVHWAGNPHLFRVKPSLGPIELQEMKLQSATQLAFQIPYYISRANGHIMQWDSELQPNTYYLMRLEHAKHLDFVQPLYQFRDRWLSKQIVLFKTPNVLPN